MLRPALPTDFGLSECCDSSKFYRYREIPDTKRNRKYLFLKIWGAPLELESLSVSCLYTYKHFRDVFVPIAETFRILKGIEVNEIHVGHSSTFFSVLKVLFYSSS